MAFKVEDATWAVNSAKVASVITEFQRLNAEHRKLGRDEVVVTEERVREAYIRRGGAIVGDRKTFRGATEVTVLMVENTPSYKANLIAEEAKQEEEKEEAPKRGKK